MSFIEINSEIGELEGVILHTPGVEIESMTPSNIQQALYSDLLNLNIASKEYSNFSGVLSRWTKTYQVKDLLTEILKQKEVKTNLIDKILKAENKEYLFAEFIDKEADELSKILIEGYKYREGVFNEKNYIFTNYIFNFHFQIISSTIFIWESKFLFTSCWYISFTFTENY